MGGTILAKRTLVALSGIASFERLVDFCRECNSWSLFGLVLVAIAFHGLTLVVAKE